MCEFLLKNNADFTPKQFLKITLSTDLLSIFLETYNLRLSELSLVAFSFKPTHTLAYGVCGGLGVGGFYFFCRFNITPPAPPYQANHDFTMEFNST